MAIKTLVETGADGVTTFATYATWWASLPSVLTEIEILEVEAFDRIEEISLSGKTTDVDKYVLIRPKAGHRHNGTFESGARVRCGSAGGGGALFRWSIKHLYVEGMVFVYDSASSTQQVVSIVSPVAGTIASFDGCLIKDGKNAASNYSVVISSGNVTLSWSNNVICGNNRSFDARSTHLTASNNIFWRRLAELGVLIDSASSLKNSYSGSAVSGAECFWTGGTSPTGSNNVSSDATATTDYPTGSQINVSGASIFTSVTPGSEDFRPLNGTTALHDAGVTVSAVTTDAIGVSRPQGAAYDVGAFEFVEGGSTEHLITASPSHQANHTSSVNVGQAGSPHLITVLASHQVNHASAVNILSSAAITLVIPDIAQWETDVAKLGETGIQIDVLNVATGALVKRFTGQSVVARVSDPTKGDITLNDPLIAASTWYAVIVRCADGSKGFWEYQSS